MHHIHIYDTRIYNYVLYTVRTNQKAIIGMGLWAIIKLYVGMSIVKTKMYANKYFELNKTLHTTLHTYVYNYTYSKTNEYRKVKIHVHVTRNGIT